MNVVKTGDGRFIEVQGTAEGPPFERERTGCVAGARRQRDTATDRDPDVDRRQSSLTHLLIATTNPGKLREIRAILEGCRSACTR